MTAAFDAVVVGGGHNGLVAATYLAKAGRRVVVLERRPMVGGATVTEEFHPGFKGPTGASLCGLLRPEVVQDFGLLGRGLRFLPLDPEVVALGDGGRALHLWRDESRTRSELAKFSARDADAYFGFRELLLRLAGVLDPLMVRPPPDVSALGLADQFVLLGRAMKLRRLGKEDMNQAVRMLPMSVRAVLNEWFETELLKASLAADALMGIARGPWSPMTAFGLVHHVMARANGGWAFVQGGMGALSHALASAARDAGVAVRTGAEVSRILVEDGRATGVQLASGETIAAKLVLSNADPKRTFLKLVDPTHLDPSFVHAVRSIQMDGCVARVNVAVDGTPELASVGAPAPHFRIAPSLEYMERAYDDAKYGDASKDPVLDVTVPTLVDPGLAPTGKHVMSVLVQYTPYRLKRGTWSDRREKLGARVLEILEDHVRGIRKLVLGLEVLTPVDLEERFGLTGGHMHHGEMTMNQQLVLRPVAGWSGYRTPVDGLYLCGSGAHPGGGVTGAPGHNAAHAVLRAGVRGGL